MPSIGKNIAEWTSRYSWDDAGEEWSSCWGSSFCQWLSTVYPRIASFFPAENILEIAPGFGRWTKFLIEGADIYRGVDISRKCIDACKKRFARYEKAKFFVNDGRNLECASDVKYNLIISFDSLVHADPEVLERYIEQFIKMLAPYGVVFIHHSNFGSLDKSKVKNDHWRDESVTAEMVEKFISLSGGKLLTQEIVYWGGSIPNDCFTLFGRAMDFSDIETVKITSSNFMQGEVAWAKEVIHKYNRFAEVGRHMPFAALQNTQNCGSESESSHCNPLEASYMELQEEYRRLRDEYAAVKKTKGWRFVMAVRKIRKTLLGS